jgi:hypothetical protein
MTFFATLFHFLKWLAALLPLYLVAGIAAGALGYAVLQNASGPAANALLRYEPGEGAAYGAFLLLTSGLPVLVGLWLIDALMAWFLFRRRATEGWVRWVFWGFGLAAGMMPVFAFISSGMTASGAVTGADSPALAQAAQTATLVLTLTLFGLALIVSWWNLRAGSAWMRKEAESTK